MSSSNEAIGLRTDELGLTSSFYFLFRLYTCMYIYIIPKKNPGEVIAHLQHLPSPGLEPVEDKRWAQSILRVGTHLLKAVGSIHF